MTVSPLIAAGVCLAGYFVAYRYYSRFLATRVFAIDPARPTPAHTLRDNVDYLPANRYVLFGHQYASITGLSPMLPSSLNSMTRWFPTLSSTVILNPR